MVTRAARKGFLYSCAIGKGGGQLSSFLVTTHFREGLRICRESYDGLQAQKRECPWCFYDIWCPHQLLSPVVEEDGEVVERVCSNKERGAERNFEVVGVGFSDGEYDRREMRD